MTQSISHRGLDPERNTPYGESTLEAFKDHIGRGFGIEFDVRFTKDNVAVVLHDKTLLRMTHGADTRAVADVTFDELQTIQSSCGTIATLALLMDALKTASNPALSALHIKKEIQNKDSLDTILAIVSSYDTERLILFDVTVESAQYLKKALPRIHLYASVSHPHDILRYGASVGHTLLSLEEVTQHRKLFDGAWLDEWDLTNADGSKKALYTEKTFNVLKEHGLGSVVVSPELHSTSPGTLGGESHPDGRHAERLFERIQDILTLSPDAICTDYPETVRELSKKQKNGVYSKQ